MSLVAKVTDIITDRGSATAEDLLQAIPETTAKQLADALKNAGAAGKIRVKVMGHARAKRATVWEAGPKPKPAPKEPQPTLVVPSAWQLAEPLSFMQWPPQINDGRLRRAARSVERGGMTYTGKSARP